MSEETIKGEMYGENVEVTEGARLRIARGLTDREMIERVARREREAEEAMQAMRVGKLREAVLWTVAARYLLSNDRWLVLEQRGVLSPQHQGLVAMPSNGQH